MQRQKKDTKALNVNINRNVHEKLEKYCDDVGQTKTLAIERILKQYLDDYYRGKGEA